MTTPDTTVAVTLYSAKSLAEVAEHFETLASDQIASKRWQSTKKAKDACDAQASVWREAAEILRNTTLEGQS